MSDTTNYLLENMRISNSAAAEEVRQVKVGAGRLFRLTVVNVNVAARFLWVFDNASASSGNPVIPPIALATGASMDIAFQFGRQFALGLRIHASSTQATFTASAGADFMSAVSFL